MSLKELTTNMSIQFLTNKYVIIFFVIVIIAIIITILKAIKK